MDNKKFLSFIIPTYNRSKDLEKTINSILFDIKNYTTRLEIIVIDNCSTDDTEAVAKKYVNNNKCEFRYYRNDENIGPDRNFLKGIKYACGQYIKLHSDNKLFYTGSLEKIMIQLIREKPSFLFCTNEGVDETKVLNDINEVIKEVSFFITWLPAICFSKEKFNCIINTEEFLNTNLIQTGLLSSMYNPDDKTVVIKDFLFLDKAPINKGGYNLFNVFYRNYGVILNNFKGLKKRIRKEEKAKILTYVIIPWYLKNMLSKKKYSFDNERVFLNIVRSYNLYCLYFSVEYIKKLIFKKKRKRKFYEVKRFFEKIMLICKKVKWRKNNKNNNTYLVNNFNLNVVAVGKKTYGPLNVHTFNNPEERLIIGNYCSIAKDVIFLLGGNHKYKTIMNYPALIINHIDEDFAETKGPIIIEDDVWIGLGSIIMSGVTVGKGAVIGAGSVVNKDCESFGIYAGNPAKLVRYRFNKKIRDKLVEFDYSLLTDDMYKKEIAVLKEDLSETSLDAFFNRIKNE